ncbi:MAG: hypothetical protein ACXWQO_07825 [Bdellovibrionota bacterium]
MNEAEVQDNREYRSYGTPLREERLTAVPPPSTEYDRGVAFEANLVDKAYRALQIAFVAVPIVAGVDKFANQLTDWTQYIHPTIPNMLGITAQNFMYGVGVVEIIVGIGIALKPRIFGDILALWLAGIVVNLLAQGQFFDVALRDFGLSAAACALARLSKAREVGVVVTGPDAKLWQQPINHI